MPMVDAQRERDPEPKKKPFVPLSDPGHARSRLENLPVDSALRAQILQDFDQYLQQGLRPREAYNLALAIQYGWEPKSESGQ